MVVLERKRLTSGTTWHAAGLITQARPTYGTREIVRRSLRVFSSLQEETGFATGFEMTGTLHLADSAERLEELLRQASAARSNGITAEPISPEQAVELFPPLYAGDLAGAVYYPDDGRGNATDTTMALAAGARQHGVRIVENTKVTGVTRRDGRVTGVTTEHGDIEAEYVVAATGMWGREFGALAGVGIPLQALAHYYVITEPIPGLPPGLPTIKTAPDFAYVRNEGAGLMVGFFEPGSYPWASRGIPADAEFTRLPEDWDHLGPFYENMMKRLPVLADTGIRLHFCGPESFTPDGLYHLGEAPGLRNCFIAAGFNSVGFLSGPGASRSWPTGSWTGARRSTCPRPIPAGSPRTRPTGVSSSSGSPRPWTSRTRSTGPTSSVPASAGCAAARCTTGCRPPARCSASCWAGSAPTGTPPRASSASTSTRSAARTGSSTRRPSTAPSGRPSACSTPPRSASSWCRAGTRKPCCSGSVRATWRSSRAASSTPSGSILMAGSRPTSPSPGSTRPGSWCCPAPPPSPATATGWNGISARMSSPPSPTSARPWR